MPIGIPVRVRGRLPKIMTVVNLYKSNYDVYIGRPTLFGNPYIVGKHGERGQCVEFFKEYFYARLASDAEFREAVDSLRGKVLGCYCKPQACHGDVIEEYLASER